MADRQAAQHMAAPNHSNIVKKFTNLAGAVVSLALVAGVGVWGYKLLVRDVSGVPVVRAAEGPMRVQPDDPGGRQAINQGLAVNQVAAQGTAAKPADRLILAPKPLDLTLEDVPSEKMAQAASENTDTPTEVSPTAEVEPPASSDREAIQLATVEALATQLAQGSPKFEETPKPAAEAEPEAEPQTAEPKDGLGRSLRPRLRPATLSEVRQVAAPAPSEATQDVDPADIAAGTRMAQLGAFESAEIAEKEWTRLSGKFGEYLADKDRVVQKAQSGGRTFYRLRAMGFADLSDARRFCSALVAENADCIPVVTR